MCQEHSIHLTAKDTLKLADAFMMKLTNGKTKYYSTRTTTALLWRDNARQVFKAWRALVSVASAVAHAMTLCPSCSASRWNSVEIIEKRFDSWCSPLPREPESGP